MLQTIDISNAAVNDSVRNNMPIATTALKGLMSKDAFMIRSSLASNINCNDLNGSGIYFNQTGNGTGNSNFPADYGILTVFSWNDTYTTQIHIDNSGYLKSRCRYGNSWSAWR